MQKYLVAAALAAALGMGGTASAADVYSGGLKDGPVYLANTWTGFYIGGHFGSAWGRDKVKDLDFDVGEVTKNDTGASGVYGVQAGYNWQYGNIVFGVEVDVGALDLNHSTTDRFGDTIISLNSGIYGDVTGRLGYAFGPALIYAKGGFAFFDGKANANALFFGRIRDTDTFTGSTVGGGLEYALNPGWSVKAEYLHFEFDKENSSVSDIFGDVARFSHDLTVDTVKLGLNYHLGHGFEPLK
jgi:opacity protein-like surface antigen